MRMGPGGPKAVVDTIVKVEGEPGDPRRKSDVRKYFTINPHPEELDRADRSLQVAVGVALLAGGLALVGLIAVAAIVATVAVVATGYGAQERIDYWRRRNKALPEPTDAAMDDLMARNLDDIAARAMTRLGLTDDMLVLHSDDVDREAARTLRRPRLAAQGQGPLVVLGPILNSLRRIGEDSTWRYARNVVLVICATEHHLAIYRCDVELADGRPENEETHEYFYQDLVAVQTHTTPWGPFSIIGPGGYHLLDHVFAQEHEFYLTVPSAEAAHTVVGLRLRDHLHHEIHLQETGIEYVLGVLRRLLRERKASA